MLMLSLSVLACATPDVLVTSYNGLLLALPNLNDLMSRKNSVHD